MVVNDQQVFNILSGTDSSKEHWIFENIIDEEYLFEGIRIEKNRIEVIANDVKSYLRDFTPSNVDLFDTLFPTWKNIEKETKVELVVGCPEMYDMMVRNNTMIIDVQNLDKYLSNGYSTKELLQILLTHDFVHLCINKDYPPIENQEYLSQLDYILFQEGFAHAIPYIQSFIESDQKKLKKYYGDSRKCLIKAIEETDRDKQKQFLIDSDSGQYWDKFGAISSKLFILYNLKDIKEIYNQGPKGFHERIIER